MRRGWRVGFRSRRVLALAAVMALGVPGPDALRADALPSLGRLFLSPDQRRELDVRRERPVTDGEAVLPRDLLPARTATSRRVVLNGVVRPQRGEPVVWVNGRALGDPAGPMRLGAGPDGHNQVTIRTRERAAVRLKPGQTWDPATGVVTDCVQCVAPAPVEPEQPAAAVPEEAPAVGAASAAIAESGLAPLLQSPPLQQEAP